uniref:Uncharacterized protein n=1 Tax=Oryza brachyantha TaxID=4533 RepID=J3KZL8_ORYBR
MEEGAIGAGWGEHSVEHSVCARRLIALHCAPLACFHFGATTCVGVGVTEDDGKVVTSPAGSRHVQLYSSASALVCCCLRETARRRADGEVRCRMGTVDARRGEEWGSGEAERLAAVAAGRRGAYRRWWFLVLFMHSRSLVQHDLNRANPGLITSSKRSNPIQHGGLHPTESTTNQADSRTFQRVVATVSGCGGALLSPTPRSAIVRCYDIIACKLTTARLFSAMESVLTQLPTVRSHLLVDARCPRPARTERRREKRERKIKN